MKELVDRGVKALGIDLSEHSINNLYIYLREIQRWNKRYNLVRADEKELVLNHLLDSLSAFKIFIELIKESFQRRYVKIAEDFSIADIGSGAGLPGIPLAIVFNEVEILKDKPFSIYLMERSSKRASFLENICLLFKLNNVNVVNEDLREVTERKYEKFDIVTARAFSDSRIDGTVDLVKNLIKIVKRDGAIVLYKGRIEKIIREIVILDTMFSNIEIVGLRLPFLDAERHVIVLRKSNYMGVTDEGE